MSNIPVTAAEFKRLYDIGNYGEAYAFFTKQKELVLGVDCDTLLAIYNDFRLRLKLEDFVAFGNNLRSRDTRKIFTQEGRLEEYLSLLYDMTTSDAVFDELSPCRLKSSEKPETSSSESDVA